MKAALLILDGLDRSSIIDLAKDQEYRDLVHRFLSPLTSLPLHKAINQANRVLKNGLNEISRGLCTIASVKSHHLLPSRSQPAAMETTSPESSLSPGISLALRQGRGPPNSLPMRPHEQIKNDKRTMVTIHFIVGRIRQWGASLQDVIDAINEAIWKSVNSWEQRVLEAWMTKNNDIIVACQSPVDANYSWIDGLDLSHLWEENTVIHVRRGATIAYVARITTYNFTFSRETLELRLGGNDNLVSQMEAHFKHKWGDVDFGKKLGFGIYLCSGSADVLNAFASASPIYISFVGLPIWGNRQMYRTMIIGLRLSDDLDSIDYSSVYGFLESIE